MTKRRLATLLQSGALEQLPFRHRPLSRKWPAETLFLQPWQKGISGQGRSFPSGHASAAFFLIAPFFIYRRRQPRVALVWLTGGIIFGVLMSIARITQGGHFLSDNLWAFGMVYLTGLLLSAVMRLDNDNSSAAVPD